MILDADQINNAYTALAAMKATAFEKSLIAADYKAILDTEIAHFSVNGEVVGSNAEQRKAFIENKFAEQKAELRQKERLADLAKNQVELAQVEVDRIRHLLRYIQCMIDDSKLPSSVLFEEVKNGS